MVEAETFELPIRSDDELSLSIDGWEGPLDLLLSLARVQKVDLAAISILELVEQYLAYISEARALKLEIAADYLVMAAWLAYLKSCLLLPKDPEADPSAEEIARLVRKSAWQARPFDLFAAYGTVKARSTPPLHVVHPRSVMTLEEALERVGRMLGTKLDWTRLEAFLPSTQDPQFRRSALASSFVAALELARRGRIDIAQDEAFAPLMVKTA